MTDNTTPKLSEVTPEETPRLIAAREALAKAEQDRDEAEAALNQRRATFNAKAATVNALRQSVQAGDMEAAERAPVEYRELQAMEQEVSDFQRVAMARREAVRGAEAELILAEAVAGIGGFADEEEQARASAEVAHQVKLLILPALKQARQTDRAIGTATEQVRGKERHVPGLAMLGNPDRPDGFTYQGQRFTPSAETRLKGLFTRAWSNATEEELRERRQEQEQG